MAPAVDSILLELAAVVGESRLVADPEACAAAVVDGRVPACLVYPSRAEQVAAVLKCAADAGLGVIPFRNSTKLGIGNSPRRYDVALSLKDLNHVWHYEPDDLTITVETGMKLGDFQRFVGRRGLWLPLDPPGGGRASLGGILATNAAGPLRLRYGAPRDMVLGLTIATTEGQIIKSGGRVMKNVAGYDLTKLLIGSCGTLGVIVEASFKLYPLPVERAAFVLEVGSLAEARELRRGILYSPVQPLRMVLLDARAAAFARGKTPEAEGQELEMWIEVGATPRGMERYGREIETLGLDLGSTVEPLGREMAATGWERISNFGAELGDAHSESLIVKATLPIAASEEFLNRSREVSEGARAALASFAQTGVGVIHLCLWTVDGRLDVPGTIGKLRGAAESLGGALVVERCSADVKSGLDAWGAPGSDFEVMRRLKQTWDPKGVLSPGRFVGGL